MSSYDLYFSESTGTYAYIRPAGLILFFSFKKNIFPGATINKQNPEPVTSVLHSFTTGLKKLNYEGPSKTCLHKAKKKFNKIIYLTC